MLNKHAYLIMAHGNFNILQELLKLIDDPRNDIYVHIDKKVKHFDKSLFVNICKMSKVYFTKKRINVKWGDSSQVRTEMLLYKMAVRKDYQYYHLLSGVDLPLKTQDEIHEFFKDTDKEYMYFTKKISVWDYQRGSWYHFPKWLDVRIVALLNRIQGKFNIDRFSKYNLIFLKGSNWSSLTNEAVKLLVSQEKKIKKMSKFTVCFDECYKQIIIYNSPLKEKIYINKYGETDDLREIDWSRGGNSPHIYTMEDYDKLISSSKLFARKFDEKKDYEIVKKIVNYIITKK